MKPNSAYKAAMLKSELLKRNDVLESSVARLEGIPHDWLRDLSSQRLCEKHSTNGLNTLPCLHYYCHRFGLGIPAMNHVNFWSHKRIVRS